MGNIDWEKEGNSGGFTVYPAGTYKVSITGYEQVEAKTGTKQIRWKAAILEPKEYFNKPVTLHTPLTEKSLWKIAKLVGACGIELKSLGKNEIGSRAFLNVLDRCLRRTCYWHLAIVPDNQGRERNEIDDFQMDTEQMVEETIKEDEIPEFLK